MLPSQVVHIVSSNVQPDLDTKESPIPSSYNNDGKQPSTNEQLKDRYTIDRH